VNTIRRITEKVNCLIEELNHKTGSLLIEPNISPQIVAAVSVPPSTLPFLIRYAINHGQVNRAARLLEIVIEMPAIIH
jgi:hypothetical protein